MRRLGLMLCVSGGLLVGCATSAPAPSERASDGDASATSTAGQPETFATGLEATDPIAYVALGDSYTIGTSVAVEERWPNQLVRALDPEFDLELLQNLGVNGYTTTDLIDDELPQLASLDADLVTVLIGVNDVVQGVTLSDYRQNVASILEDLRREVPMARVVVVSTPDYTLTPKGLEYGDPERQSQRISRFNEIAAEEASARGLPFVDISAVSDLVPEDSTLVAVDGLHPSGKQYAGWVELIAPAVRGLLEEQRGP